MSATRGAGRNTEKRGCSAEHAGRTARCTIPRLPANDAVLYRWTLTANPHQTTRSHDTVLPITTGTITTLMPVVLRHNKYQAELESTGQTSYSGLDGDATYYSKSRNTQMLHDAKSLQQSLRACGFYVTDSAFNDALGRSLAAAGISTTVAKGIIDEAERTRMILKNATREQLIDLGSWTKVTQATAAFGKAMARFATFADATFDYREFGPLSCAIGIDVLEAIGQVVPVVGPLSVALFEVGGAKVALHAAYQEEVFTAAGQAQKCVVDLRPALGVPSYGVWGTKPITRQDGYGLRCT